MTRQYAVVYARSQWDESVAKPPEAECRLEQPLDTMPPYGAAIATNVLRRQRGNRCLGLYDEQMLRTSMASIIDRLREQCSDTLVLFFSVYVFNNDRTATLIERIKARYSDVEVVVGGPFAEFFVGNDHVDAIIVGNAESGVPRYLERSDRVIIAEPGSPTPIDIDFGVIHHDAAYEQGVIGSIRGCKYRTGRRKGCSFCSLQESTVVLREPGRVLQEMAQEARQLDVDWFFDGSDSFAISKKWLQGYATVRERMLTNAVDGLERLNVYAYANACDVKDEETVELLYRCGVRKVFIGIESGDDHILSRTIHKPKATVEHNRRAIRLFAGSGIEVRFGIVLGVGETDGTLSNTYHFLDEIRAYEELKSVVLSPVLVMPGSELYRQLLSSADRLAAADAAVVHDIHQRLASGRGISKREINSLSRIYVESSCSMSYGELIGWRAKMADVLVGKGIGLWTYDGNKDG